MSNYFFYGSPLGWLVVGLGWDAPGSATQRRGTPGSQTEITVKLGDFGRKARRRPGNAPGRLGARPGALGRAGERQGKPGSAG